MPPVQPQDPSQAGLPPLQPPEQPRPPAANQTTQAIDFVKDYSLGGDRGTIAQQLQLSYMMTPGNEDEWAASGDNAGGYLVQYRVFQGGKAARKEPITYIFQVDLSKPALTGYNPAAQSLLATQTQQKAKPRPRAQQKPAARRPAPRPKQRALPPGEIDLLPLPDEPAAQADFPEPSQSEPQSQDFSYAQEPQFQGSDDIQ